MSIKKLVIGLAVVAAAFGFVYAHAETMTAEQLQAQIAQLQALIAQLGGGTTGATPSAYTYTRSLTVGSTGADVMALQKFLIGKGFAIAAGPTGTFGPQTKAALAKYQTSVGITPASGYFGPITMASLNSMVGTGTGSTGGSTGTTGSTGTSLQGGAGDITVTLKNSGTNDQVFEGDEGTKVLGMDVKAEGSDVSVNSVKVDFTIPSSVSTRLNRYVDSVDVMVGGKVVGSADVDSFTKNGSHYSYNIPVKNAVVKENQTDRFYVAINAANTIDTNNLGASFTVAATSLRFEDATGALFSDTESSITNTFTFEKLSTAGDVSLTVSEDDTSVNDAHTVQADNTSDTNNVELLSFKLKAKGADITLNSIPFTLTSSGAGVTEILNDARLMMDGKEVGDLVQGATTGYASSSLASSTDTTYYIKFQNLDDDDVVINEGDTANFTLEADINDLGGAFTTGDSLTATLTGTGISAEDQNGDSLVSSDKKGSANSDGTKFAASGITTSNFVTTSAVSKDYGSSSSPNHQGEYVMTFQVTAFQDPAYIALTAASSTSGTAYGVVFRMEDSSGTLLGSGTTTASVRKVGGQGSVTSNYLQLNDGETATLELTVNHDIATTGYAHVQILGVNFNQSSATTADQQYVPSPADQYESSNVYIANP